MAQNSFKDLQIGPNRSKYIQINPNILNMNKWILISPNWFWLVQVGLIGLNRSNNDKKVNKYKNQDQAGNGLSLCSCLFGICMENKYILKMLLSNISSFADASNLKK